MKIVIDANVWISALAFGGNPRKVFEIVVKEGHYLLVSEQLFTEIRRKIHEKFPDFIEDFENLRTVLALYSVDVKLGVISVSKSRDPNDDYLLEMAEIASADLIITGDKDLLVLKKHLATAIVTSKEAIHIIQDK